MAAALTSYSLFSPIIARDAKASVWFTARSWSGVSTRDVAERRAVPRPDGDVASLPPSGGRRERDVGAAPAGGNGKARHGERMTNRNDPGTREAKSGPNKLKFFLSSSTSSHLVSHTPASLDSVTGVRRTSFIRSRRRAEKEKPKRCRRSRLVAPPVRPRRAQRRPSSGRESASVSHCRVAKAYSASEASQLGESSASARAMMLRLAHVTALPSLVTLKVQAEGAGHWTACARLLARRCLESARVRASLVLKGYHSMAQEAGHVAGKAGFFPLHSILSNRKSAEQGSSAAGYNLCCRNRMIINRVVMHCMLAYTF